MKRKSPAGYRTGHFPEIRPDTGPDLLSGTPLKSSINEVNFDNFLTYFVARYGAKSTRGERTLNEIFDLVPDPERIVCWFYIDVVYPLKINMYEILAGMDNCANVELWDGIAAETSSGGSTRNLQLSDIAHSSFHQSVTT